MKKLLTILLVMGALVSCGGNKEAASGDKAATELVPEEGAVLKVWESAGIDADYMREAGKAFEEKTGVKVEIEEIQHTDSVPRLIKDSNPDNGAADLFALPHDRLGDAINGGIARENLVSTDRVASEFTEGAVNASKGADGKLYAFPLSVETYALFYNKDLLPEVPGSFEELIEKTKGNTKKANNEFGLLFEPANFYFTYAFLGANGGYVFGKNGTDPSDIGLNNEGSVKGLTSMLKLKEISTDNAEISGDTVNALFKDGKVASVITGPWVIADYDGSGVNYGIAALPTIDGKHPTSFSGVRLLAINSNSKYPKAAQLFADFASSPEMLKKRYELTGQIPPVKSLLEDQDIKSNEKVAAFLEQVQYAVAMPAIPEMGQVWDIAKAAVIDAWKGDKSPKEALDKAANDLKSAIQLKQ